VYREGSIIQIHRQQRMALFDNSGRGGPWSCGGLMPQHRQMLEAEAKGREEGSGRKREGGGGGDGGEVKGS